MPNAPASIPDGDPVVLQLLEEQAVVSTRVVQGATVRVTTTTSIREQEVAETLARETLDIERVPVGRVVEAAPATRQEGDITIIPVMEEVLVVERRLVLKEEVRIRRIRTTEAHHETVQLRSQAATVIRSDAGSEAARQPEPILPTTQVKEPS